MRGLLDPKMDFVFKNIFGTEKNSKILISFLNTTLNPKDLIIGVQCGKCEQFGMIKIKRTWQCPTCSHRDSEAHLAAVKEWFVLIGVQMSNSDCREFLQVSQHQTVTRILQGMDLKIIGKGKATKYKMNK